MGLEAYFYKLNRKVDNIETLNKLEDKAIDKTEHLDFEIAKVFEEEGEQGVLNKFFKNQLESAIDMLFLDYRISLAIENVEAFNKAISDASLDEGNDIIIKELMGYWIGHADLQKYMKSLYKIKGLTGDMNCTNFILTKEDLITLITIAKLAIKGEYIPTEKGFNWEDTHPKDWERTIEIVEYILETTDFNNETVYYYSWW